VKTKKINIFRINFIQKSWLKYFKSKKSIIATNTTYNIVIIVLFKHQLFFIPS